MAFAKQKNIDFREDSTNIDNTFQRNFLRNEILPRFEKINPNYRFAIENFIQYVEIFALNENNRVNIWIREQNEKFFQKKEKFLQKNSQKNIQIFSISDFLLADAMLQYAILENFYKNANNGNFGLSEGLLDELFRFVTDGKNSF